MNATKVRKGLTVFVVAWLVLAAVLIVLAGVELMRGKGALEDAKANATAEGLRNERIDGDLERAASTLGRSHAMLDNPVVAPFRIVPVLGRQLSSITALSGTASTVADTGVDALRDARPLATGDANVDRGKTLQEMGDIAGRAADRLDGVDFGPRKGLLGPVADAYDEVAGTTVDIRTGMRRAEGAAHGAAALFQNDGRYLVVAANTGEMRSGSGMFLSAGVLQTGGGKVRLGEMTTVGELSVPNSAISWPSDVQAVWGWLGNQGDMRNLMLSPRFDVSAPLAAEIWQRAGKENVDGVMMVDAALLRAVIAGTGPITVDGKQFNKDNIEHELTFQQYEGLTGIDAQQVARREILSGVASKAFEALDSGNWDAFTLARELGSVANSRHVMLWARDEERQRQWVQAGVAGTVDGDSIMLNMPNLGANKLDQFMHVDATINRTTGPSGIEMSISAKVTNDAPEKGSGYVLGPTTGSNFARGQYRGVLAMTVPGSAQAIRFDGDPKLVVAGVDGPSKVAGVDVDLMPGQSKTFVVRYTLPSTDRVSFVRPSARIPATTWHYEGETWVDTSSRAIRH